MNNLLQNLNSEQLAAVKHKDGPLLIVAGAGTGKTTVIAQRVAYLIEQGLAGPDEILALTFTEKAAGEMADRVGDLLPFGYFDLWISTFHSFSERILKEHGLSIGLSTDFKLLNEFEQWALIKKNLAEFELDYYRPLGHPAKFIRALLKHFSRAKDEDISPAAYLAYAEDVKQNFDQMLSGSAKCQMSNVKCQKNTKSKIQNTEMAEQEAARLNEVANAYHVYEQLLLDNNALDFGDLINYSLKLFRERPAILETYRRQFKYILLDELQDTNWSQYELIKILAAPKNNLTVVGDDDQSIFRFRGASMSNILQFAKDYPRAKKIILTRNYRSRQNILDLSYEFIKQNNPNRLEWQLNSSVILEGPRICGGPIESHGTKRDAIASLQYDKFKELNKKLIAQNNGQGEIKVIEGQNLAEEVEAVVNNIIELKNRSRLAATPQMRGDHANKKNNEAASWNDFAILVRANDSANVFMDELDRRGLPYIFGARRGLYLKPVIMDAIAYFKLLDNYHESPCLWRILNLPVYNFTDLELADFNHLAHKKAWSLYEVLNRADVLKFSAETRKKITPLLALIAKHSAAAREKAASEIFLAFMNDSGYLKYLADKIERESSEIISQLNQFLKRIRAFEARSADKSVKSFLLELNLEMEAGEAGELAVDPEAGPEAIKILTAHGAKGLEFKYIFIANLVDKRFPTIERGEQIGLPDALIKEILPVGDAHLEEERRLFYVAMTRAKAGLYFSWARDYGGLREKKPSRFLMELGLCGKTSPTPPLQGGLICPPSKGGLRGFKAADKIPLALNAGGDDKPIIMPAHFSYSQLAAYASCPYQYRFAHILKIPVMGKEQFSFGKTMHATLQKLFSLLNEKKGLGQGKLFEKPPLVPPYQGGEKTVIPPAKEGGVGITPLTRGGRGVIITFEEILKLYKESWVDDWYESKEKKQERKKQGREILKVFYEKHQNHWPEVLFLEKGFNFKIADGEEVYTVRGVIDRIDQVGLSAGSPRPDFVVSAQSNELGTKAGQAGIKLVDYKTGRAKKDLSFQDKEQLFIYQLAAQELFKEPVSGLAFYYLDNNSQVEFIGRPEDLKKVKLKIISTIKEIGQGEFPPRPSRLCAWCDFREICEFKE